MSYTKTTWSAGDKVTSAKLNNIENGIESVVSDVASLSSQVSTAAEQLAAAEALISTNKETIETNAANISANVERIQTLADNAEEHISAAQSAVEQINGNVTAIANLRTDVDAVTVTANAAKTKADANETAISGVDTRVSALEGAGHIIKSQLSGLVAVDGVNVTKAKHEITTTSDNKKKTAMIFNESDGGGCMFTDETKNRKTFIGVNEGENLPNDGSLAQSVDAQFYSKDMTSNVGTRMNFSIQGIFYTKNKNNGSYTADDEIMTRGMINDLLSAYVQRISDLESEVNTLKTSGPVLSE